MEIIFIVILVAVALALVYFISSSITLWIQAVVSVIIILVMIWLAWLVFSPVEREIPPGEVAAVSQVSEATAVEDSQGSYPVLRVIIWILFVLLLPLLTSFIVQQALDKKTNLASFMLLAAYTALDLLAALILSGFRILGVGGGLAFIAGLLLCAGYNYFICSRLAKNTR